MRRTMKEEDMTSHVGPKECTIFSVSFGNTVLFGNNEDSSNPSSYIRFTPSSTGNYGGVYVGTTRIFPDGGMNEKGLCYDQKLNRS